MADTEEEPQFPISKIKTDQDCQHCKKPLIVHQARDSHCNNKHCKKRLNFLNGKYVTYEVWFSDYIMPMLGETSTESVEETNG